MTSIPRLSPSPPAATRTPRWWLGLVLVGCAVLPAPTATAARLRNLTFEPASLTLAPSESRVLRVLGAYDDGTTADLSSEVVLESRDSAVAEVNGVTARGRSGGETTIRARHPATGVDADDPADVTVLAIRSLAVSPAEAIVAPGQSVQLRALATLADGRGGADVSDLVEWESGKKAVIAIAAGLAEALRVGDSEVRVKDRASGVRSDKNAAFVRVRTGTGGPEEPPPGSPGIVELEATPTLTPLLTGESTRLQVVARLEDGTQRDVTREVTFESSREGTATVDAAGVVRAVGPGRVSIRIAHPSGKKPRRDPEIWVGQLVDIGLTPATARIAAGQTLQMRALAIHDNGRSREMTDGLSWSSSDARVLVVSDAAEMRGLATAVAAGRVVVQARDRDSGVQSRSTSGAIEVTGGPAEPPRPFDPKEIQSLSIDPPSIRLFAGDSQPLHASALLRDGSVLDVTDRIAFQVRDSRVAAIEGTRLVALASGETDVTAEEPLSRKRSKTSARLHVARLLSLRIEPARLSLAVGARSPLRAVADFDDGSRGIDVTQRVRWTSSRPTVAIVDDALEKGSVHGIAAGNVEVRVEDPESGRRSDGATGRVQIGGAAPPTGGAFVALEVEPPQLSLTPGEQRLFSVLGVRADGTRSALTANDVSARSLGRREVSVKNNREIVARRGGFAEVEVTSRTNGLSTLLPVTVREVERIVLEPANPMLRPGGTVDLRALATFNDGSPPLDVTSEVSWRTTDSGVASIESSGPGRVLGRSAGTAQVVVQHRSSRVRSDDATGHVRVIGDLVRLSVEPRRATLAPGDQLAFRALGTSSDGAILDVTSAVTWSTIDPLTGVVDQKGLARAVRIGEFRVRVVDPVTGLASSRLSSGTTGDDAVVTVRQPGLEGIQVAPAKAFSATPIEIRLGAGETQALFALGKTTGAVEPVDLTARVEWISSAPNVAPVSRGLVGCSAQGIATISAVDPGSGIRSADTLGNATVICAGDVRALRIDPARVDVDLGKTKQMRAYRLYSDGHEVDVTRRVLWKSSHPAGVSIVETGTTGGMATALGDVLATITAFDPAFGVRSSDPGGGDGKIGVRGTRTKLEIFPIYPAAADSDGVYRGRVGELARLRARVTYASGATQGVNLLVQWTSSDPSVVEMGDGTGELAINQGLLKKTGRVTITALWPGDGVSPEISARITLEVVP